MEIADLHIHSLYSRATSKDCTPESLDLWARKKGITLVGTGDFTHPAWRDKLSQTLVPAPEEGLYLLRDASRLPAAVAGTAQAPRFIITGEISSIYKKNGKVRKVHNLILLPSLQAAQTLSKRLEIIGNLHSDGRPILGLDSRDLLEITLESCEEAIFIPAHIWTPHFSLFGAFSGFDTIEECFEDLTDHIRAVETGLSSDPPMNWRLSALDGLALVSNSDAHSPSKLGREANLLSCALSYPNLKKALDGRGAQGLEGTIEFFPEEGKYHYDGHRKCSQCLTPAQTAEYSGRCPVCGGKITVGVLSRVEQLADRPEDYRPANTPGFESLIPLAEIIAASTGYTPASAKVQSQYEAMLAKLGPEFYILRECPSQEIERLAGPSIARGVQRMRAGEVSLSPGYDGEYGKVTLFTQSELDALSGQTSLFGPDALVPKRSARGTKAPKTDRKAAQPQTPTDAPLNEQQLRAVRTQAPAVAVIAGPGTGKTKTLVSKICSLLGEKGVPSSQITAITFTNKAASEMSSRLTDTLGKTKLRNLTVCTFHSLCLKLLKQARDEPVRVLDESEAQLMAREVLGRFSLSCTPRGFLQEISRRKSGIEPQEPTWDTAIQAYEQEKTAAGVLDFDDLLREALSLTEAPGYKPLPCFRYLLVDEFQDVNRLQYQLIRAWSQGGKGLFVIGDPDQSIYGFRGSWPGCFDALLADYPACEVIRLRENYRSTPQILGCALPVIGENPGEARLLSARRPDAKKVRLIQADSEFSEALFVAKEINRLVGGIDMLDAQSQTGELDVPRDFSDIAVLVRTHRQIQLLEKCLAIEGIPYLVAGREDFLSDPSVRGILALFQYLQNPGDRFSLQLCLAGCFSLSRRQAPAAAELLLSPDIRSQGDPEMLRAIREFSEVSEELKELLPRQKPVKLLQTAAERCARPMTPALEHLLNTAVCFSNMQELLSCLSLGQESDIPRSGSRRYYAHAVTLTTLHGAKGLEYPVVFLCGVREGVLPLSRPGLIGDISEERRLFYVGMTRAMEELILSSPGTPSPFLAPVPASMLETSRTQESRAVPREKQLSLFD